MTPEIKERIAQIRRGEVPEGYKNTKAGIYPIMWEFCTVGDCIQEYRKLSNDISYMPVYSSSRKGLMPQSEYYDGKETIETNIGYKVVPVGYATYRHMSDDDIFHFNVNCIGTPILVSSEYPVFTASTKSDLGFLIPVLNSTARFRYFCRTQKLGGTRTRLYLKNLMTYQLCVPDVIEQQKIAAILTAQDKVIELKEKLIAEKQRQKKYLMQQLFTKDIQKIRQLSEIADIIMGQSPISASYNEVNAGLPLIQGNADIENRIPHPRMYTTEPTRMCKPGNILLSVRAPVGSVALSTMTACIGRGVCAIYAGSYQNYLYQYLLFVENKWGRVSQGSTFESISGDEIAKLKVPISTQAEKVSEVLSTADREIDLLQQELEQEKQKKKALMQLLLTGIVRVNL